MAARYFFDVACRANRPAFGFAREGYGLKNPCRANGNLHRHFNMIWVVQSPLAKIIRFPSRPNQWLFPRRPDPTRGRIASRHETRDGMWWTRARRRARQSRGEVKLVSGSQRARRTALLAVGNTLCA